MGIVRDTMNGFITSGGSYVSALAQKTTEVAGTIGKVAVVLDDTTFKVPPA